MNQTSKQLLLTDKRTLGYAEYGPKDGYPIVYCHGSQSSRLEMHYDMSFAEENGLRIITVDRPGHGLSDFNPKGSILGFAEDVNQLTAHQKLDRFAVAGMSAGGPFAMGLAYAYPNQVSKLAVISGFAPYTKESKKHLPKEVKTMLGLAKSFPFLLKLMLKFQAGQLAKQPRKALKGFLKMMSEPDQEILQNEIVMKVIEEMFKEAFRNGSRGVAYEISKVLVQDWGFDIKEIKVPVSFWQGLKDNNVPYQWAEWMSGLVPNAKLNTISAEGHLIIFEHAKEIFSDLKEGLT